jgi:uncharacterized protein (TIGR03067 family)
MRKLLAGTVVVLMLGMSAWGGDATKDKQALQGTWTLTKFQMKGEQVTPPAEKKMQFVFKGDTITMRGDSKANEEGTFKLDAAKTPKQITLTKKGGGADDTRTGIYEVKGDTLKLAFSITGPKAPLPKGFEDPEAAVLTFKKEK